MTLSELAELARAATPGPWENSRGFVRAPNRPTVHEGGPGLTVTTSCLWVAECTQGEAFYNGNNNAPYLAALSPERVLAMLAVIDAWDKFSDPFHGDATSADTILEARRALDEALR